jgi:hypothetical protein
MATRLKFDGLPEGTHTFVMDGTIDDAGIYELRGQFDVQRNQIVEVEDLNAPHDLRAHVCRKHVETGIARVIEGKASKKPAAEAPAKS